MKVKIMFSSLWMQVLLCLSVATIESHDESHPLCFYLKTPTIKQINVTVGNLSDGNTTERCSKPTDSCYILWQEDPKNKTVTIISQGCWNDANQKCQQNECIPARSTKALDHTHFCCCEGNYCNTNITDVNNSSDCCPDDPTQHFLGHMSYTLHVVIIFVAMIVLGALVSILYFVHRIYCTLPKRSNESLHLMEAPPPPNYDLDTLKIQELIARGRYGSVHKAVLNDQTVAVKVFSFQNQKHFYAEQSIYLLPHMEHPNLPVFIGSKEQTGMDGRAECLLVVSYTPLGCLQSYLRENTVDWNGLCKLLHSTASGLAHLHNEVKKGDKLKPAIVHRDITTRNILVKPDGTCMWCDFGFAIQISGATYILNGEEVKAEETSLADVGTLRYMAPEILEGAVNLRDCESSLKQTDIYALGLVMWEVASRCSDLHPGQEVPPYKLPFEAEVGNEPTMEKMQILILKHKSRPLFPDHWKTANPAVRSLKETIEDCWDHDAEARLTALCVEERMSELPVLWERDKAGLNMSNGISSSINTLCNLKKSSSYINKSGNDSDFGSGSMEDQLISSRERANSLSECTTETLLSPSEAINNDKNKLLSHRSSPMRVTYPLQPHQGRNPCMERNLMNEHSHDGQIVGNSLQDVPMKYSTNKVCFSDGDANIFNMPEGMQSNLLPREPAVSQPGRIVNPIPYVQNPTGNTNLKQTNLTGHRREVVVKNERRWNPLSIFEKSTKNGIRASLKLLLDRKATANGGSVPEEQQPLKSPVVASPISPSDGQTNPITAYWTEMKDGGSNRSDSCSSTSSAPDGNMVIKSYDHHLRNGHAISVHDGHPFCVPNQVVTEIEKSVRPTTLPLSNNPELEESSDVDMYKSGKGKPFMRRRGSSGKKKGVKRVKTPFEIKGRLSLYDDRIMSSQELPTETAANVPQVPLDGAKFSASVPLNMNALCLSPATGSTQSSGELEPNAQDAQPVVNRAAPQAVFALCDI